MSPFVLSSLNMKTLYVSWDSGESFSRWRWMCLSSSFNCLVVCMGYDIHIVLLKSFTDVMFSTFVCLGNGSLCSVCVRGFHEVDFLVLQP